MKSVVQRTWFVFLTALLATGCQSPQNISTQETLVWCGLDYSKVKMIGTQDFRNPSNIFPGMLAAWNYLFVKEMLPKLNSMAEAVKVDIKAVSVRNENANAKQIVREDGTSDEMVKPTHISENDIADCVRSYELKNTNGLGLVFIMDRLVKAQETTCIYVVFFDTNSRQVLLSERICAKTNGAGFRNRWFGSIKSVVDKLPKKYKAAKLQIPLDAKSDQN